MAAKMSLARRFLNTMSSVRTGIILLIILGVVAAAGTVILQSPPASPEELQRAYSPQVLAWLTRLGLTNIFHAWWFALLLALVSLCIVLASLERFPNAWRYFARPYRRPDPHFRAVLPARKEIRIRDAAAGLDAAERAFRKLGLKPQRVVEHDEVSLYAERHRFSVLGAYVVHVALLLIFAGFIVDSIAGYRGFLVLTPGRQTDQLELQGDGLRKLPFTLRCDGTGNETYADGTPKRYWSKLTVLENGHEVMRKEIIVNDPLVYRGIRFYQASQGATEQPESLTFAAIAMPSADPKDVKQIKLGLNEAATLDASTRVRLLRFIPDYYRQDNGEIFQRSREVRDPAIQLQLIQGGKTSDFWMFPAEQEVTRAGDSPYVFRLTDLSLVNFTGLSVSYEPGQWGIWGGTVLLAMGLAMAFYFVHMRFWALPVKDEKGGLLLWVGGAAGKNRESFEERFCNLVAEIEKELDGNKARAAARSA